MIKQDFIHTYPTTSDDIISQRKLKILPSFTQKKKAIPPVQDGIAFYFSRRRIQHIFNKDPVPSRGVVHHHVRHSAHNFPVLDNRGTAHG